MLKTLTKKKLTHIQLCFAAYVFKITKNEIITDTCENKPIQTHYPSSYISSSNSNFIGGVTASSNFVMQLFEFESKAIEIVYMNQNMIQ